MDALIAIDRAAIGKIKKKPRRPPHTTWTPCTPDPEAHKRVIKLESDEGQKRLKEAAASKFSHYQEAIPYLKKQKGNTTCSLVTVTILLNTLLGQETYTEDNFWTSLADILRLVLNQKAVTQGGATLGDIENLSLRLNALHSLESEFFYCEDSPKEHFLEKTKTLLSKKDTVVGINYHPGSLIGSEFCGHFSPVVAYHSETDSYLVCDCWPATDFMWVPSNDLWDTMNTKDWDSKSSRGWFYFTKK